MTTIPDIEQIAEEMATYTDMLVSSGLLHLKGGNCSARLGDDLIITRTKSFKQDIVAERLIRAPIDSDDPVENASSTLSMHRCIYRKTDVCPLGGATRMEREEIEKRPSHGFHFHVDAVGPDGAGRSRSAGAWPVAGTQAHRLQGYRSQSRDHARAQSQDTGCQAQPVTSNSSVPTRMPAANRRSPPRRLAASG